MPRSSPPQFEDQLAGCELFEGLSWEQRASIASLITQRVVEPGTPLMREGDAAAELIVIQQGSVEVTKRVAAGDRDQRIATLRDGAMLGEMTLVDRARRSATVRAIEPTRVGILLMDRLERLAATDPGIEKQMLRNLANQLSRRLRFTNETTVAALEQQIDLERTRSLMGRFVVFLAFLMVTYAFALRLTMEFLPENVTISAVSFPLILLYSGALYHMMRRSGAPFESFGLTLHNWRPAVREALLWTVPMCALATLMKLALLWGSASFADQRLFNLSGVLDPRTPWSEIQVSLVLALLYAAAVPLQEFIVRGGLQTSLQRFEVGPSATVRAIVISNALFASSHLHLALGFAIFTFVPGLLWGVLYARQGSLVGVSVSHILCGWFVFLVLGFEPWY
jgi:CRP/FNR family transcriptional regulator, cyclic AMP receptor protein